MRGIKYISCLSDFSGYGDAARNYVLSLHKLGVPITVVQRNFDRSPPKTSSNVDQETIDFLTGRNIEYDIVLIHLTPDLWPLYCETGKKNIGFVAWETTKLHPVWASSMNSVDGVLVPCEWNKKSFIESGVVKPVGVVPHGIDVDCFDGVEPLNIPNVSENTYKFYSIFQWSARKNPEGLLRSYFNTFGSSDDVVLILKAYIGGQGDDREVITKLIRDIKRDMDIGDYPRVILIPDLLSKEQMIKLHRLGDCYIGLHRGEGWGLPYFEAGLCGNPVIATGYSGNMEFMTEDNSYLVDYSETFVSMMSNFNRWYQGNQIWAEPSQIHASELMRHVYDNREESKKRGLLLQKNIKDNFSWGTVASKMVARILEV